MNWFYLEEYETDFPSHMKSVSYVFMSKKRLCSYFTTMKFKTKNWLAKQHLLNLYFICRLYIWSSCCLCSFGVRTSQKVSVFTLFFVVLIKSFNDPRLLLTDTWGVVCRWRKERKVTNKVKEVVLESERRPQQPEGARWRRRGKIPPAHFGSPEDFPRFALEPGRPPSARGSRTCRRIFSRGLSS